MRGPWSRRRQRWRGLWGLGGRRGGRRGGGKAQTEGGRDEAPEVPDMCAEFFGSYGAGAGDGEAGSRVEEARAGGDDGEGH